MPTESRIYLDNAATSSPKPEPVIEAMVACLREANANPGRSGHAPSLEAARIIFGAREALAAWVGARDPARLLFTAGATAGLNLILKGLLGSGDRVVVSGLEHNAVMRPLRHLQAERTIRLEAVPSRPDTTIDLDAFERMLRRPARAVVACGASNVTGAVGPLRAIAEIAHRAGALLVVDGAQLVGAAPIDIESDGIDALAFSGHKHLFGPQGIGALALRERLALPPLVHGGTGSRSEEEVHPTEYPDALEGGTPNTPGVAGLAAALAWLKGMDPEAVWRRERALDRRLCAGLASIRGVRLYGGERAEVRVPIVSFNVEGVAPDAVAARLEQEHGILCRAGLHCAPRAHRTQGSFPAGAVRFGLTFLNGEEEIDRALDAVAAIARGR